MTSAGLEQEALFSEDFLLAVPCDHPLAGMDGPVPLSVLATESVLLLEEGHCLREQALSVCTLAATVGGVMPLIAKSIRVDPAVFSTPFISTFCDATGLLLYFSIAKAVLGI